MTRQCQSTAVRGRRATRRAAAEVKNPPGPDIGTKVRGDFERAGARAVPTAAPVFRAVRTVSRDWECLGQVADRDHRTAWCSQLSPRRSVWGTPAARCESRCPFQTSSGPLVPHLHRCPATRPRWREIGIRVAGLGRPRLRLLRQDPLAVPQRGIARWRSEWWRIRSATRFRQP